MSAARRPAHRRVDVLLGVAAGGALGAPARYGLESLLPSGGGDGFPWGTFAVNVSGSFLLSALVVLVAERLEEGTRLSHYLRPVVGAGFLGAYTTYSTYALQVDSATRDGFTLMAAVYALASLAAGAVAAFLGLLAGRLLEDGERAPAVTPLTEPEPAAAPADPA